MAIRAPICPRPSIPPSRRCTRKTLRQRGRRGRRRGPRVRSRARAATPASFLSSDSARLCQRPGRRGGHRLRPVHDPRPARRRGHRLQGRDEAQGGHHPHRAPASWPRMPSATAGEMTRPSCELFAAPSSKAAKPSSKSTPDMLPVLKQAGVVDSGGTGLTIIYRGMLARPSPASRWRWTCPPRARAPGHARRIRGRPRQPWRRSPSAIARSSSCPIPRPEMRDSDVVRLRKRLEQHGRLRAGHLRPFRGEGARAYQRPRQGAADTPWSWANWTPSRSTTCGKSARERHGQKQAQAEAEAARRSRSPTASSPWRWATALVRYLQASLPSIKVVDGGQTMNPCIEDIYEAIEKHPRPERIRAAQQHQHHSRPPSRRRSWNGAQRGGVCPPSPCPWAFPRRWPLTPRN